jgi:hypothetical protein
VWVGGREGGVILGPWVLRSLRGHTIHSVLRDILGPWGLLRLRSVCALLLLHLRSELHQGPGEKKCVLDSMASSQNGPYCSRAQMSTPPTLVRDRESEGESESEMDRCRERDSVIHC